jgi:heme exporter protein A
LNEKRRSSSIGRFQAGQFTVKSLTATDLACARGGIPVFAGVSFRIEAGGLLLVRGTNGSGKSSLLRVLGGLARPSAGTVSMETNEGPVDSAELAAVSHLVGHRGGITDAMTVRENLEFHAALLGNKSDRIADALNQVGLGQVLSQRAGTLSAGQRKRLALARLLAVPRALWLLDEPTEALDTLGEGLVAGLIEGHRARGGIVIVASHGAIAARPGTELRLIPQKAHAA